jgi:2-amino-4-hydroxy-6-hydroxymethyldihydropteridine diphosphokinase
LRRYFVALGSNVGDRLATLTDGWTRLRSICQQGRLSSIYETRPLYVTDQPLYLNAVAEVQAGLEPQEMLAELNRIETELGRDRAREVRMGPRTLDLDIVVADSLVLDTPGLTIPHPRITERQFVLVPLLELEPELVDPRTGLPFAAALAVLRATEGEDTLRPYAAGA